MTARRIVPPIGRKPPARESSAAKKMAGYGSALKRGIAAGDSEFIAIIDADGTYPASGLLAMLETAEHANMVVGARNTNMANVPFIRRPAKFILNILANYLAQKKIPDLNSGLRVFRRGVLTRFIPLLPMGFSFTTTITLCMICSGLRVVYVPIEYGRRIGNSKIRFTDFFNFVLLVLRTIVLFNPLRVFLPLGFALFLLGVSKLIYDIFIGDLSESAVLGILAAIIIWSFGLIADMDEWGVLIATMNMARIAAARGDVPESQRYFDALKARLQDASVSFQAGLSLLGMGYDERFRGHPDIAKGYFEEGLKIFKQLRYKYFETVLMAELGHIARLTGESAQAQKTYRETITRFQDFGNRAAVAHQLECFAAVAIAEEERQRAAKLLGAAEALREKIDGQMTEYERMEYDQSVELHATLLEAEFNSLWAEGRSMSMEQAIRFALG